MLVLVEVEREVSDHVEPIADNNQWQLLGQLGFLQEIDHADWLNVLWLTMLLASYTRYLKLENMSR